MRIANKILARQCAGGIKDLATDCRRVHVSGGLEARMKKIKWPSQQDFTPGRETAEYHPKGSKIAKASLYQPSAYAILSESPWMNFLAGKESKNGPDMHTLLDSGPKCGRGVSGASAPFSSVMRLGEQLTQNQERARPPRWVALRFSSLAAGYIVGAWRRHGGIHSVAQFTSVASNAIGQHGVDVVLDYEDRKLESFARSAAPRQDTESEKES